MKQLQYRKKKFEKIYNFLIFIPILSYVLGFYFNENSAGMGSYAGDSDWIRKNIDIFLNNNLKDAILHPEFFGNRSPLIYIINKFINPFYNDFEKYRFIVFSMSILSPIIFYHFLKIKFYSIDKRILFLISSLIYLSPYYRTSGYWGLNENYGILATVLSLLFFEKFISSKNKSFYLLFLNIFFSSLAVYFDLKLLIIPLYCFISVILSNINIKLKTYTVLIYFVFSLPYFYLIYIWGGIVPIKTQKLNPNTITELSDIKNLYFIHIGYAATIISFYLLPVTLFTTNNLVGTKLKRKIINRSSLYILTIFIIYIVYNLIYFDFEKFTVTDYWVGLGVVHKLTLILTNNIIYQEIITYIFFFFSFILLYYYYLESKFDIIIISFFIFISLLLWPLMQEYFDPIITIIAFALFRSIKNLTKKNSLIIFSYLSIFLIVANLYYS